MESTPQVAPAAPAESAPATEQVTTTTAQPPEGQQAPGTQPTEKPERKPSRAALRIDELTRQRYEEQRGREAAEARLAQIERERNQTQAFAQLDAEEPQIDRFNSLAEYQRAYGDWTVKKATAHATTEWEKRMQEQASQHAEFAQRQFAEQQRVVQENAMVEEKMGTGVKKYPDFMDAITNPELPSVRGTPLFAAVLHADNAADIAYSLAKNPAELERLLSIRNPVQIMREVFALDQKFSGSAATTAAPPPPPPRNGSAVGSKDWTDMSTAEHVKAYRTRNR